MRYCAVLAAVFLALGAPFPASAIHESERMEVWLAEKLATDAQDVLALAQDTFEKGDTPAGDDWSALTAVEQFNAKTNDLYLLGVQLDAQSSIARVRPVPPPVALPSDVPVSPLEVRVVVRPPPAQDPRFRDLFWQCRKVASDVERYLYPSDLLQPARAAWDDRIVPTLRELRTQLYTRENASSTTYALPSGRRVTIAVRYSHR